MTDPTEALLLETLGARRNVLAYRTPRWLLPFVAARARAVLWTDQEEVLRGLPAGSFALIVLEGRRELLAQTARLASPAAIFALLELPDGARPNVYGFGPFKSVACAGGLLTLWRQVTPTAAGQASPSPPD